MMQGGRDEKSLTILPLPRHKNPETLLKIDSTTCCKQAFFPSLAKLFETGECGSWELAAKEELSTKESP
jgi:hypothetical protein